MVEQSVWAVVTVLIGQNWSKFGNFYTTFDLPAPLPLKVITRVFHNVISKYTKNIMMGLTGCEEFDDIISHFELSARL